MLRKILTSVLVLVLLMGSVTALADVDLSNHETITVWLYPDDYTYYSSYNDNPVVWYLNEKFNMTLDFQIPPMGSEQDQFNLMIGTGEYTDVFINSYAQDTTAVLYEDGIIRDLAPYLDEYMPNFKAFLDAPENADVKKNLYDPEGHLFSIPAGIRVPDEYEMWGGFVYRYDILETMTGGNVAFPSGNEEPTTVEDWEYMLELMKQYFEAAGFKDYAPLILPATGFIVTGEMVNGFGAAGDFYVVDGEVRYGPATTEFYNYLVKMHEWYEKGYIYKDFASRTTDLFYLPNTALTYGGAAGVWFGLSSQLEDQMSMPEYGLNMFVKAVAAPLDTANGQDGSQSGTLTMVPERAESNSNGYNVTTLCSEEKLIRFLTACDFLFTEEGAMMHQYGLDKDHGAAENPIYQELGLTDGSYYFDENGEFHWHEKMDPGAEGHLETGHLYGLRLPGLNPVTYIIASDPERAKVASQTWMKYGTGNNYPSAAYATAEESSILTSNYTSYNDYLSVMVPKFITGTEELTEETFRNFVDRLMSLGVEECLKLRQEIYDRYQAE